MIRIGKIVGTFVGKVRHGSAQARHLQIVYSGGGQDVKTAQYMVQAGVDSQPNLQSVSLELESGESMRFAVATEDFIAKTARAGEFEIYSAASAKKARVKAKNNGKVYVASVTNSVNLHDALSNLVQGIQGATCVNGSPPTDTTGKIALALTQINNLLDGSE